MQLTKSQSIYYTSRDVGVPQPRRSRDCVVQGAIVGKKCSGWIAVGQVRPLARGGSMETPGEKDGGSCWMPVGKVALIVVHILFVAWGLLSSQGR